MTAPVSPLSAAERSALYAGFAQAFRFPGEREQTLISAQDYTQAFYPAVSGAACSLHESRYSDIEQTALFEELSRCYQFFGLGRSPSAELPDHLCVELEFMHYMTHIEQQAELRAADTEAIRSAQRDFLSRHLARFVRALAASCGEALPRSARELIADCDAYLRSELAAMNCIAVELEV